MKMYRICPAAVSAMPLLLLFILDLPQNANIQAQRQNQDSRIFGLTLSTDPVQNAAFVAASALAVGAGLAAGAWITNQLNSGTFGFKFLFCLFYIIQNTTLPQKAAL